jgi:hypothetical protein
MFKGAQKLLFNHQLPVIESSGGAVKGRVHLNGYDIYPIRQVRCVETEEVVTLMTTCIIFCPVMEYTVVVVFRYLSACQ